jgi:hypothetical protein
MFLFGFCHADFDSRVCRMSIFKFWSVVLLAFGVAGALCSAPRISN